MHPEDAKALSVLKRIPFVDDVCREVLSIAGENINRGENLAMYVKVCDEYMPEVYDEIKNVACVLGIDVPELFVYNDPVMNAYTFGETRPYVCVSSSLIEKMSKDELRAILAHECGHILCKHVLYGSVVETLRRIGDNMNLIRYTMTGPIELALQYWSRRSEFSADRCAALVAGEEAFQRSMLKFASGLSDIGHDPFLLVKQAKEYHQHENQSMLNRIQQNCRMAFFSHPQMVNRAYEVNRWTQSNVYKSFDKL